MKIKAQNWFDAKQRQHRPTPTGIKYCIHGDVKGLDKVPLGCKLSILLSPSKK